ncbi:MAG: flagellar basal body P-ring formation chaperone FlgA [Alphaproteobacteria bacterium]
MRRPARLLSGLVVAAWTLAAPAAALELAPGQAFDRAAAQDLLGPPLARAVGVEKVRIVVEKPRLPLGNPYPAMAEFAVAETHPTAADDFVAVVTITVGERAPLELALRGRFDRLIGVPVPKGRLEAGRRLAAVDFETRWLTANRLRGEWVRSRDTLDGQEALRALIAGQPVARDAIGAHRLVRRGERVTLVFATDGLHLEASGTARGDAGMDEAVEVENDRSGTIVTGRVRAAGRVHVETRR